MVIMIMFNVFSKFPMAFPCPGAESRLGQQRLRPAPEPCQERPVAQAAQTLAGTSNLPFLMGIFMGFIVISWYL